MRLIVNEDEAASFLKMIRETLKQSGDIVLHLSMDRPSAEQLLVRSKENQRIECVWGGITFKSS